MDATFIIMNVLESTYYVLERFYGRRIQLRRYKGSADVTVNYSTGIMTTNLDDPVRAMVILLPLDYRVLEKVVPQLRGDLHTRDRQFLIKDRTGTRIGDRFIADGLQYDVIEILHQEGYITHGIVRNIQSE